MRRAKVEDWRSKVQIDNRINRHLSIRNTGISNGVLLHCDQFHPPAWWTAEEHQRSVQRTNRSQQPKKHGKASRLMIAGIFCCLQSLLWGSKKEKCHRFYFEMHKYVWAACCHKATSLSSFMGTNFSFITTCSKSSLIRRACTVFIFCIKGKPGNRYL